MTAPSRSTVISRIEPAAPSMVERAKEKELAPLTTPAARRLIEPLLRPGVTLERVLSETYFAMQTNPKLAACTPESLVMAVAKCVAWDLPIGEKVHLVPFSVKVKVTVNGREVDKWEDRAQAIRDYKGDIDLVVRAGAARYVDAQNVYKNELFQYEQGTQPFIRHQPIMDRAARGALIGSYAVAKINAHDIKIVVLSRDEIDDVRMKHSKQWKEHWVDGRKVPYTLEELPWYGPKTCVHRVTKMLPTSPKLAQVLAEFEQEETADADGALDPANQIAAPDPAPIASPVASPSSIDERAPLNEPTPAPQRSAAELWPMPFGGEWVGKPIGDVPTPDLEKMLRWAMQNGKQADFVERASQILDDRRWAAESTESSDDATANEELPLGNTTPPQSGGSVPMPRGGRVEDALTPNHPNHPKARR